MDGGGPGMRVPICGLGLAWSQIPTSVKRKRDTWLPISVPRFGAEGEEIGA